MSNFWDFVFNKSQLIVMWKEGKNAIVFVKLFPPLKQQLTMYLVFGCRYWRTANVGLINSFVSSNGAQKEY